MINNKYLIALFANYLNENGFTRISSNPTMTKYRLAYQEACNVLLTKSVHHLQIKELYDFSELLRNYPSCSLEQTSNDSEVILTGHRFPTDRNC